MSLKSTYDRLILGNPGVVVALILVVLAFFLFQSRNFKLDASSDALLLENDPDLRYYTQVKRVFGSDEFLIITFRPNGDLFSRENLAILGDLVAELRAMESVDQVNSLLAAPLFHSPQVSLLQLASGFQTLEKESVDLDLAVVELTESELYRNFLISPDGKTTAIQVTFTKDPTFQILSRRRQDLRYQKADGGLTPKERKELAEINQTWQVINDRHATQWTRNVAAIRTVMERYRQHGTLYLGGVPMIVSDMVDFIKNDLVVFGIGVILFLIVTLGIIFRSWLWVLLPMSTCISTGIIMIGTLGWTNWRATVISSNFLLLLFIITMSMAIHFAVRYRNRQTADATRSHRALVLDAAATVATPCFYCTLTTMVGFGSLLVSGIKPVIEFGRMMACGIGVAYLVVFLFMPAMMMLLPRPKPARPGSGNGSLTERFARLSHHHGTLILVVCFLFLIAGGSGITMLSVENRFIDYFKESTEIYRGMEVIDEQLGGTTPLELVLDGEGEDYWWQPENRARLRDLHQYLESQPEVGKVLSLDSVMQVAEKVNGGQPLNGFLLSMLRRLVPADLKAAVIHPYVNEAGDQARIELRVRETFKELKREALIAKIEDYLAKSSPGPPEQVRLTGIYVLYNNLLQSLFTSQILTIGVVFLATWLMFCILFRSLYLATIAIVPNIFPVVFVLGTLGWLGIPLDIVTITIAAITIGIAVDHTIHYVVCFQREFPHDRDYVQTMYRCHGSIGKAMYYTSLTIILGFSILALSNFIPNIYFGLFTGLAMTVALLAAMTLLPKLIMLLKPLGRKVIDLGTVLLFLVPFLSRYDICLEIGMSATINKWIERKKPNPFAKIRLFCFPYAGGGTSIYSQWSRHLPREVEKIGVVLPGREMRLSEKSFTDVRDLANALADGLEDYFDKPFAFFGHSMGALISFELCRELRRRGKPLPIKIFVAGHRAPQIPDREAPFFDLPDDQFIEKIRELEGTPQGVLENEELMAFFVPILKADMTLCDTYTYREEEPISCPILVLGGYKDEQALQTELIAWRSQTTAAFRVQMFSGGHFFIHDVRDQILQLLTHELTALSQQL